MSDTDSDQLADLPVNDDGTHVATLAPSGVSWACPLGYLDHALSLGYTIDRPAPAAVPPAPVPPAGKPAKPGTATTTDPIAGTPGDHA